MSTADSNGFQNFGGGPNEAFGGNESFGGTPPINPEEVSQKEIEGIQRELDTMPPEATYSTFAQYQGTNAPTGSLPAFGSVPTAAPTDLGGGLSAEKGTGVENKPMRLSPDEAGGFTARSNRRDGEAARNDRESGLDAEARRENAVERARQNKEKIEEAAIQEVIDTVFGKDLEPEENKKIAAKLRSVFSIYGKGDVGMGMQILKKEYDLVNGKTDATSLETKENLLQVFRVEGFSDEESEGILNTLSTHSMKVYIEEAINAGNAYDAAVLDRDNKTDIVTDGQIALADMKGATDEELGDALDALIQKSIDAELARNPNSERALRLQENLESAQELKLERRQLELQQQEAAAQVQEQTNFTADTALQLVELGVGADVLESLSPEGQAAVEAVVQNGGGKIMGAVLSNPSSRTDEQFTGTVAGQFVSLDFSESELYLIGENAADRANRSLYRIDPPTPAGFEGTLIRSVGEQNRMPYIANHNAQALGIYAEVGGNPLDESFPEPEDIDRFRNFLVLLVGEGNPDEAGEEERLQALGILTSGVESVDRSRVRLFTKAIDQFVPGGMVRKTESPA